MGSGEPAFVDRRESLHEQTSVCFFSSGQAAGRECAAHAEWSWTATRQRAS